MKVGDILGWVVVAVVAYFAWKLFMGSRSTVAGYGGGSAYSSVPVYASPNSLLYPGPVSSPVQPFNPVGTGGGGGGIGTSGLGRVSGGPIYRFGAY